MNAPGTTINGSVAPIRKLNFFNVLISARSCAITLRRSRLRAGLVAERANSVSARFNPSSVAARYGLGSGLFLGKGLMVDGLTFVGAPVLMGIRSGSEP